MQDLADQFGDGWRIPPMPVEPLGGLGHVSASVGRDWLAARLERRGPHPLGTYREPAQPGAPFPIAPTVHISCSDKPADDPMPRIASGMAAMGMTVHEIPTGHFAMLTMPDELAEPRLATT